MNQFSPIKPFSDDFSFLTSTSVSSNAVEWGGRSISSS